MSSTQEARMWKQVKFSYYMFPDAQHMGVVTELVPLRKDGPAEWRIVVSQGLVSNTVARGEEASLSDALRAVEHWFNERITHAN
jgi:hypothetical protein